MSQLGQFPPCLPQHVKHEEDAEDHLSREDEVAVSPVPQHLLHVPDGAPQVGVEQLCGQEPEEGGHQTVGVLDCGHLRKRGRGEGGSMVTSGSM